MRVFKVVYNAIVSVLALIGLLVIAIAGYISTFFIWPDISYLKEGALESTAFIELRQQQWAEQKKKTKLRHKWVPLAQISPFLQDAVLIAEDDKFWDHFGFDLLGIQEALQKNMRTGKVKAGGSTITQQLAKNLFLSPEKTATRKLKEAILAFRLEQTLGKKRILELYLNSAEWGPGIFGAEAAAQAYFGKHASQLDPREACRLAVVLPNPLKMNPAGESKYVMARVDAVYGILVKRDRGLSIWEDLQEDSGITPGEEEEEFTLDPEPDNMPPSNVSGAVTAPK